MMISIADACEFCAELRNPQASRFGVMYASLLTTRVVRETPSFVVLPTVGQMFAGSMLIIPREHVETLAGFESATGELISLMESLNADLARFGDVVTFEH